MIDNTNIKSATNRRKPEFEINRVVVESYTNIRKNKNNSKEDSKIKLKVKVVNEITNVSPNSKNIENINDEEIKSIKNNNNDINTIINKGDNQVNNNFNSNIIKYNPQSYISCSQESLTLISHIKKFDLSLAINNSTLNYLISYPIKNENENNIEDKKIEEIKEIKEKNSFWNNLTTSSSTLFIRGEQNLKRMSIHLSKTNYNNIVHKEITDFIISKNKNIQNIEINPAENNTNINKVNSNNINISDLLKSMNKRWKEYEKVFKMRLTYISSTETIFLNKKQYFDELMKKINITSAKEPYLLIKQDRNNANNKFIYELITPLSNKELETSVNNFMLKDYENLKESDYILNFDKFNKRTNQNKVSVNNEKKKSKFDDSDEAKNNNSDDIIVYNKQIKKEPFNPVFIFNQKQMKYFLDIMEEKGIKKDKSKDNININNSSKSNKQKKGVNLNNSKDNKQDKLTDINFNIYPIKIENFQFIHSNSNEIGVGGNNLLLNLNPNNNNIDVSNIALNQSDYNYMKPIKAESEFSNQKLKETEDFSQNTPISLLQEKYFLYAVSKWAKYSVINPQEQFFIKYFYTSGHPKFDSINLDITNFTLWIEKIHIKSDSKQSLISSNSNYLKTKSNKINNTKRKVYKSGASIFLNESNHHIDNKKKSKSKPKIDKKKNQ